MPFLRINGHAAVIAHVLVAAGGDVEQRGLSAVRVADKGDSDHVMPLLGETFHLQIQSGDLVTVVVKDRCHILFRVNSGLGLVLTDDINEPGLGAPQRNLIAKYFIFNRIFQRSVQHDRNPFSGDEAHFDKPFPEAPVTVHLGDDANLTCL